MRFYLDEDLSPMVAKIARARGLDALSAHECGYQGLDDHHHLEFAASQGRCLVTRNRDDFIALTVSFFERGLAHDGILVVTASLPGDRFAEIAAALANYDRSHPEGLVAYAIDFLHPDAG